MKTVAASFKRTLSKPGEYKHFYTVLVQVAGVIVANNLAHGTALRWINFALAIGAAFTVRQISNDAVSE